MHKMIMVNDMRMGPVAFAFDLFECLELAYINVSGLLDFH